MPDLRTHAPAAGDDLVLSLDLKVQQVAEKALGDHRGAVVALNPKNGDVFALASRPGLIRRSSRVASRTASTLH